MTAVSWTTENWDNNGLYDASQPTRLTPTRPGRWVASAYVYWAAVAGSDFREIRIEEGVTTRRVIDGKMSAAGIATAHNITGVFDFPNAPAAGEYLEVIVLQNSGAGLVCNGINIGYTLTWLGPE